MSCATLPLREVRLYGELARRFGRLHRFAVANAAEAVRALMANYPEFERALLDVAPGYRVQVGRRRLSDADQLRDPSSATESIRIVPVVAGAKSALGQIVFGAALIAAAVFVPGLAAVNLFGGTTLATVVGTIGISMVLGGVSQLLSPQPKLDANSGEQQKPSYVFNGAVNTTAQGNPVPVGYGRLLIGSAVISAGIAAEDIAV